MSARGKALVAKLRKQAGVRDAEALAAYLGRFKAARKAGKSVAVAKKAAKGDAKGNEGSAKKSSGVTNRGRKAPTTQGSKRKLTKAELTEGKKRSDEAVRKRFGSTGEDRLKALVEKNHKDTRSREDEYAKLYKNLFAGTDGRRTFADDIVLRKGMEVQFKDRPTPGDKNPEVVKVHGPNEVEVRETDGTRKKYPRTALLLVLPKDYRNKKKKK